MVEDKYLHIKCLHPQHIVNPYTKEPLIVSCGKCEACLCQKAAMRSLKCKLESLTNEFCLFVTLTYSNDYVPLLFVYPTGKESEQYGFENYDFVDEDDGLVVNVDMKPLDISILIKKTNIAPNCIPYLRREDAQLFLKRLRKNISKYTNEKIRYFCVGEYGPVHFRPHLHLLLWFNSKIIRDNIRQDIYKSWPFGRIDSDFSRGKCAGYVAGYLNSFGNIPRILLQDETKPYQSHSRFLGEKFLQSEAEEVLQIHPVQFTKRCVPLDGVNTEFSLWRSLKTSYFPLCHGYASKSFDERYYSYTIYATASRWTKEDSPYLQAKKIIQFIKEHRFTLNLPFCSYETEKIQNLLDYFKCENKITDLMDIGPTMYERLERNIYMQLRISKRFLDLSLRLHKIGTEFLKDIENYYSTLDYYNLKTNLQDMQEYSISNESDELCVFYANTFDEDILKNSPSYKRFTEKSTKRYRDSFKHKKLNDLNNYFKDM